MILTTLSEFPAVLSAWALEHAGRLGATDHFRGHVPDRPYEWEVYLRLARHAIHGELYPTLDLATISVRPDLRRQGIGASLIQTLEQEAIRLQRILYVENVLNPNLELYLRRRGYQGVHYDDDYGPTLALDPA